MYHIKRILSKLFNPSFAEKKPFNRMDTLKHELTKTIHAYDLKIAEAEQEYSRAVLLYERAYSKVTDVQTRYRNKLVTEILLKSEQEKLTLLEEAVRDKGHELDTLKTYKKEEVLRIVGKIDALKEKYIQKKAEEVKLKAYQIQQLRLQQLELVSALREDYSELIAVDKMVHKHMHDADFDYAETMADELSLMTDDVPLTVEDIALPEGIISGVMMGKKLPFDLYSIVEKGKKQRYIK